MNQSRTLMWAAAAASAAGAFCQITYDSPAVLAQHALPVSWIRSPSKPCQTQNVHSAQNKTSQWSCWQHRFSAIPISILPLAAHAEAGNTQVVSATAEAEQEGASQEQQSTDGNDQSQHKRRGLLSLEAKRRYFFNYERRIRDNSTLEKVFDYFSSQERDGVKYMNPLDLLSALVPTYPPSQSEQERSGSLPGERAPHMAPHASLKAASESVFARFDVDGDGFLSFWEFTMVLTLLSIAEEDVEAIFRVVDADGSGAVDAGEWDVLVRALQERARHAHGGITSAPGRNIVSGAAARLGRGAHLGTSYNGKPSGLLLMFFGPDQQAKLQLTDLMQFLAQLHVDLARLEFAWYDVNGDGVIPAVDFARAFVAVADVRKVGHLLNKVDALPENVRSMHVSLSDFCSVINLHRKAHQLYVAMDFLDQMGKPLTRHEFKHIVTHVANIELSDSVIDILMALLGEGSGDEQRLNSTAFLELLHRRATLWAAAPSLAAARKNIDEKIDEEGIEEDGFVKGSKWWPFK